MATPYRRRQRGYVCTKIDYRGYEISISMDTSHCRGSDLIRSDIRIFKGGVGPHPHASNDVTGLLFPEESMLYGTAEELIRVFERIRERVAAEKQAESTNLTSGER